MRCAWSMMVPAVETATTVFSTMARSVLPGSRLKACWITGSRSASEALALADSVRPVGLAEEVPLPGTGQRAVKRSRSALSRDWCWFCRVRVAALSMISWATTTTLWLVRWL
jgi:hypothetical protein